MLLWARSSGGRFRGGGLVLQTADEEFPLVDHLGWEVVVEEEEEFLVAHDFLLPLGAVDGLEGVPGRAREGEAIPIDVFEVGGPADWGFFALGAAADAVHDPLEDAHVFAVSRPDELAIFILAEPVDVEDARSGGEGALHLDPVPEVVAHVV